MPEQPQTPDLDKLRKRLDDRDARRAKGLDIPEEAAENIARALLGAPPADLDCETVQQELPAYVDAEARGAPATPRSIRIAAHLRACEECEFLYIGMLERELDPSFEAELAERAATFPQPDLVALRHQRGFENLQGFVQRLAQGIIRGLQPAALPELSYLAEPFFRMTRTLSVGAHLGFSLDAVLGLSGKGRAEIPAATRYLAATFIATRDLGARVKPDQLAAMQADGSLEAVAKKAARQGAIDAGFSKPEAVRFAEEYARLLATFASELPLDSSD